jgi:hypothetical protein
MKQFILVSSSVTLSENFRFDVIGIFSSEQIVFDKMNPAFGLIWKEQPGSKHDQKILVAERVDHGQVTQFYLLPTEQNEFTPILRLYTVKQFICVQTAIGPKGAT